MDLLLICLVLTGVLLTDDVSAQMTCEVGNTDIINTRDFQMTGVYLDIDHPAKCSGSITVWHFCHYAPWLSSTTTYTSLLQVWRETSAGIYTKMSETTQSGEIPRRNRQFLCVDVTLSESEYIEIKEGDILGFYMPGTNGLRMVGRERTGNSLYFVQPVADVGQLTQVLLSSTQELTEHVLHLSADIVQPPTTQPPTTQTTTIQPTITQTNTDELPIDITLTTNLNPTESTVMTTMSPTSSNNITTGGNKQQPGGLSGGGVAAIIIVLLIVVAVAAAIVVVVVLLWYKRGKTFKLDKSMKRKSGNNFSYDNAMYEEAPVRSNSALANYLNSATSATTDYEIPISTKAAKGEFNGVPMPKRAPMESMYIAMEGGESLQTGNQDFTDSFETYPDSEPDSERYTVHRRTKTVGRRADVFDIYRSFGPDNEIYCQFMEETASQTASLPQGVKSSNFDLYADPPTDEDEIYKDLSNRTRTIDRNKIKIMEEIGSGEFAYVNKAMWQDQAGALMVAVKTLHSTASQEERVKLLQEAAIMGQFIHPNVVRLIGVVKDGEKISLVTEYCAKGDLCVSLKELKPDPGQLIPADTPKSLLSYSQQVALAMHYLSSKGFVHRDLAARNIFVTQDNICKVGDFGMSRDLANAEYYLSQGGAIPVRWTAPEAIYYSKYSTASDIWSYGCLLFEIWSIGRKPFGGLPNTEVLETVRSGYRLAPPPGCPEAIYQIMIQCWNPESIKRPLFRDILQSMLRDDNEMLSIPVTDASSNPQAAQLGASLESGKGMYLSLQHTYLANPPSNKRDTIYEAIEQFTSQSHSDVMSKPPLTPQSSFASTPPPLPSTPIPAPKPTLAQKMSIASIGSKSSSYRQTPPLPTTPIPSKKPPLSQKPSIMSNASEQPLYGNTDDMYDDIEGMMLGAPLQTTGPVEQNNTYAEEIYEDIVDPVDSNKMKFVPGVSNYEVPIESGQDPCDMDYEEI